MFDWIRNILTKKNDFSTEFEKAFSHLNDLMYFGINGKMFYELLSQLDSSSTNEAVDELVNAMKKIKYSSNTNGYFYFYFPIVSHILYYKPELESKLLSLIIGPNFANGESEVLGMITLIQGAMEFTLKENPNYLTTQSQLWVKNTLPKLKNEIKREIEKCWEKINEQNSN